MYGTKSKSNEDPFPKHYQSKGKVRSATLCEGRVEEAAWTVIERRVMSSMVGRKQQQEKIDPGHQRSDLHTEWLNTFINVNQSIDLSYFRLSFVKYKG